MDTDNITILAETLENNTQLTLYREIDVFGGYLYHIKAEKDGKEISNAVFGNKETAIGIYNGLKEYCKKDIS